MYVTRLLVCLLCLSLPVQASSEAPFTVATWNMDGADGLDETQIRAFGEAVAPDIVLVDEVLGEDQVRQLAQWLSLPHYAYSDFDTDTHTNPYSKLEVAILSRWPVTNIVEYEQRLDGQGPGSEVRLTPPPLPGLAQVEIGRGYLVADIPALELTVIVTHLKSSRGASGEGDHNNARKREVGAAAIAQTVAQIREARPTQTVLVGGDFNVGERDATKIGSSLTDDENDGYDDTHALMTLGLVESVRMRSLSKELDRSYAERDFGDTGPIDVLYVLGPNADAFEEAQRTSDSFGSDHYAVYAQVIATETDALIDTDVSGHCAHDKLMATLWLQQAAEYGAITNTMYRLASHGLREKVDDPYWSADLEQREAGKFWNKPPAVILDIDETVLDNSPFQARLVTGEAGTAADFQASWDQWVGEHQAELVPGAAEFLSTADRLGIDVFFVTNRNVGHKDATLQNLAQHGLQVPEDRLLMRGERASWDGTKVQRRAHIAQSHRIIMLIGDDLNDMMQGVKGEGVTSADREERLQANAVLLGEGWFVLPNPNYGSWSRALPRQRCTALRTAGSGG